MQPDSCGRTPVSPWSMHVCAHTHSHTCNNPSLRKYITIPVQCRLPKTALPRIHGYNSALWQPVAGSDVKLHSAVVRGGAERKRRHANAGITASVELPWNSFRPWILFKGKANDVNKSNIAPLLNFRPKHKQINYFSSEGMGERVIAFEKNTHIPLDIFT